MTKDPIDISVVIGFRNWGLTRLELAVRSIQASFGALRGEVIVSDYGSDAYGDTRDLMESLGARYVYTTTDGTWSRSRALNAGFAVSSGAVLVSTDADMVFSPQSMETIGTWILEDPSLCLLLQCRDLPEKWADSDIERLGYQWDTFERVARLRPRWGMGGMMAVPREVFMRIRGLDERMHTYGGEDIDFATRAKRAGQRLLWVDDERVRMYHMWHAPTRKTHEKSVAASNAIAFNKEIVYTDKTFVRNTPFWLHRPWDARPLVTVAISTFNRANFLAESINSVLCQTLQDFEIVVVDDGSTDNTRQIVESFDDHRIRYFFQENSGIAAARNRAADEAHGYYTAVHDDDDLMTPWRLEKHFEHIVAGTHGSFGSFVNFDDSTGEMKLFASKILNDGTILDTGGAPGHGTWLVETDIIRRLRYDESLSSGVDNNLALRMVRSGVALTHSGEIMMMRRVHDGQITVGDETVQKTSARQTRQLFSYVTTKWGADKLRAERGSEDYVPVRLGKDLDTLAPFLPDSLVRRVALFRGPLEGLPDPTKQLLLDRCAHVVVESDENDNVIRYSGVIVGASMRELALLRRSGVELDVTGELMGSGDEMKNLVPVDPLDTMEAAIRQAFGEFVACQGTEDQETFGLIRKIEPRGKASHFGWTRKFACGDIEETVVFSRFASTVEAFIAQIESDWIEMEVVGDAIVPESLLEAINRPRQTRGAAL
ncbi:Glycosyltransferase involved in cell wall bisynthesis [Arthrobacter sp. ok909]|uniref:glycosyltransferase n=1 Tax=Arthrobacter sp. ok909 TaxID=1761746 RepID=UPI000888EFA6|nr:glycosyltransferase [Arthrobacter sp. ok909]SDP53007.1 Glycosyltransferase involved in cell wall bisynthesis [Arthrobacter sp. ok909]